MKIALLDSDPRLQSDPNYFNNMGSFSAVIWGLNKALEKLGYYEQDLDKCDFVGTCDGINVDFKYNDKKSFVINVWETIGQLPYQLLTKQAQSKQRIFGLSNQITNLWQKYKVPAQTVYGGCDTDFWQPTKPKKEDVFQFVHVNSSNVRSGLDLTIQAFHKAFKGNKKVKLFIKDTNNNPVLINKINQFIKDGSNIEYVTDRWNIQQIRDLFSESHACLNMLRMTSFGMPLLECSACNCLSVAGDFSPTNELVKEEYGVLLRPSGSDYINRVSEMLANEWGLLNCYPPFFVYLDEPTFYTFDVDIYALLLSDIHSSWDRYDKIEKRKPIIDNWKWENGAKKLVEYLKYG